MVQQLERHAIKGRIFFKRGKLVMQEMAQCEGKILAQVTSVDIWTLSLELNREVETGDIDFGMINLYVKGTNVRADKTAWGE